MNLSWKLEKYARYVGLMPGQDSEWKVVYIFKLHLLLHSHFCSQRRIVLLRIDTWFLVCTAWAGAFRLWSTMLSAKFVHFPFHALVTGVVGKQANHYTAVALVIWYDLCIYIYVNIFIQESVARWIPKKSAVEKLTSIKTLISDHHHFLFKMVTCVTVKNIVSDYLFIPLFDS